MQIATPRSGHDGVRDSATSVVPMLTEAGLADFRRSEGATVILRKGRYWVQTWPGFYAPIHLLARLTAEQAASPASLSWGFRAALRDQDGQCANGAVPVHLLTQLADYDMDKFSSKRRSEIRKSRRKVRFVEILDKGILEKEGHAVVCSAAKRTRYGTAPYSAAYLRSLPSLVNSQRRLILAGLLEGRLGGYLTMHAVDGTAYVDSVFIATEAMPSAIGTGLAFELVQICRRTPGIREIVYGMHAREDQALCAFKEKMQFQVRAVPAMVHVQSMPAAVLRRFRPHVYYRLTGDSGAKTDISRPDTIRAGIQGGRHDV